MNWSTKCGYLKRNHVRVAWEINYIFKKLWGKIIVSGMHPIGQIFNYDDRREHQGKGTEDFHTQIHVLDAAKLDEHDDDFVTDFINKYVTCSLPYANERPE